VVQDSEGKPGAGIVIKDSIATSRSSGAHAPDDFDVIATLNLNGDYLSDALAAQVGGIGIAPAQHQLHHRPRHLRGHARHRAQVWNKDVVNPGSWCSRRNDAAPPRWIEAADLILKGLNGPSTRKVPTIRRQMEGATEIKCSASATTSSRTCNV